MSRKKYYTLVLTGGPCGGKTSGIVGIADHLESLGFRVIIVSEAATRAMEGRIDVDRFGLEAFQTHLIRAALNDELLARRLAEESGTPERPVIVLLDRTWHDSRAYMQEDLWLKAGRESEASTLAPLSRYDGILHLASTAVGRADLFEIHRANNPVRIEKTPAEAIARDEAVRAAYHGAERWRFIGNEGTFAQKIETAITAACQAVGVPEPLWFQRKFLVKAVDFEALAQAKPVAIDVFEYWLDGFRWRRRRLREDGSTSFARVQKVALESPGEEIKIVTPTDDATFMAGWNRARQSNAPWLDRTRYSTDHAGTRVVFDAYSTPIGRMLFEAHVGARMAPFEAPPWIELGNEVTADRRHTAEYYANPAPP